MLPGNRLIATAGWAELSPADATELGRPMLFIAAVAATIVGLAAACLFYSAVRDRWFRPARRRLQYSLARMLLIVTLVAVLVGGSQLPPRPQALWGIVLYAAIGIFVSRRLLRAEALGKTITRRVVRAGAALVVLLYCLGMSAMCLLFALGGDIVD